ncbi:hypothetical protein [Paracoccus yeei]|uniref:hypothetical protein n=1 Tax=Paracoccus yeei TaxID=147645 RepID=UPI003BF7DA12
MAKDTIGIDVSKDRLDAFWHSRTEACCLPNTPEGFGQLCAWLGKEEDVLIVFEATGAYHRGLSGIWVWRGCLSSKSIQSRRGALRKQSDDWQRLIASTPECWRAWALC